MSRLNDTAIRLADIAISATAPGAPIPYILEAAPFQPSDISSISLPFIVVEGYGGPTNIPIAAGQQFRDQRPVIVLAVTRIEGDTDLKYSVQNLYNWGDSILATFAQHVKLSAPPKLIVTATNANPIQITTASPHRFNTGDQVTVSGVTGNTNANGPWNVTVIDYLNFTVPAVGNGVGDHTGTARLTQPGDMVDHVVYAVVNAYKIEPYEYGTSTYLALLFPMLVREMYVTTIAA